MSETARERLEAWYGALNPREQLIVRMGTLAAAALIVLGIVFKLHGVVQAADKRVAAKRADAAYIKSVLPELRAAPLPAPGGQSLVTVVDRTTRDQGLAMSLKTTEPSGIAGVRARFEGAPFEALVGWLLRVEREYGLTIQAATLEKTDAPGRVNATFTFVRS